MTVVLQNRSPVAEVIPSLEALSALVDLSVDSLGSCASPLASPLGAKTKKPLPIVVAPKGKLKVGFVVPIDCANDPLGSTRADPGHEDFSLRVVLDRTSLGGVDADPADDLCPRIVPPPGVVDPYPDGKIRERGCGSRRPDGTFGDPVLLDVIVKP